MGDHPPARAALLEAAARGRRVPHCIQVRPGAAGSPAGILATTFAGLLVEELQFCSEEASSTATGSSNGSSEASARSTSQAWVPLRLVKQQQARQQQAQQQRLPVVILLHATGCDKGTLAAQQAEFARRGYLAAAIDCRYHGDRSQAGMQCWEGYQQALVRAWRGSGERPFLLDNVWDLMRLLDYLQQRPDVDCGRIGMTGVSLGGMHTWLTAAADERVAVAAPMIGVQHFGWAVQQQRYHARVESVPNVFQAAAADLAQQQRSNGSGNATSRGGLTAEVVAAVWGRLLPGLLEQYDAPLSLPLLAPRPLLVANGELDPRCPMKGVELAMVPTRAAYARHGAADKLQLYVVPACVHHCTDCMWEQVFAFMDKHLQGAEGGRPLAAGSQQQPGADAAVALQ